MMTGKTLHDDRGRAGMRSNTSNRNNSVCVDVGRVLDSCSDRDCVEDLRVYFTACDQQRVDNATSVRAKSAKVVGTCIDVDELPFKEGCYSCNLTFYVEVKLELSGCDCGCETVCGLTSFEKKVVLYGGVGTVQVFSSEFNTDCCDHREMIGADMPRCTVQAAQPVVLSVTLADACGCGACGMTSLPNSVRERFADPLTTDGEAKIVLTTLGMFTIVQMIRNTQMLIPVYDYCLPCKDCHCDEETPCDLFKKMSFPIEEFFPPMGK